MKLVKVLMLARAAAWRLPAFAAPMMSLAGSKPLTLPVRGEESLMSKKAHGTCEKPVQEDLRWACDRETADRICCFNRHYAEFAGYWRKTNFLKEMAAEGKDKAGEIDFYDSVSGAKLFTAPRGRTFEEFVKESDAHGWPSFRDEEVNWDHVRVLDDGGPSRLWARTSATTCPTATVTATVSTSSRSR